MEVSGQLHTWLLYPHDKSSWYTLDRRLDGSQGRSGHGGREKNPIVALLGIESWASSL